LKRETTEQEGQGTTMSAPGLDGPVYLWGITSRGFQGDLVAVDKGGQQAPICRPMIHAKVSSCPLCFPTPPPLQAEEPVLQYTPFLLDLSPP
jgi:hypothetical protein